MWAEIGDCRLHYVEVGSSEEHPGGSAQGEGQAPTLLMLHGGPGFDHTGFRPQFDRYGDRMRVVYFDQRGQGRSSRSTPDHWCLDVWADDVVRLCEALEIRRPVVFGQSFGGMVAMRYAARHPDHARAIVLSSTSAHLHLHERILPAFEAAGGVRALRAARAFFADPDPERWAAYARHCVPLYNTTPQAASRAELRLDVLCHFFASEAFSMDLRPGLARVTSPVLVVSGSEDPITPPEDARDIVEGLPAERGSAVRFAGAGHGVWRDRPADFFSALDRFLDEVLFA